MGTEYVQALHLPVHAVCVPRICSLRQLAIIVNNSAELFLIGDETWRAVLGLWAACVGAVIDVRIDGSRVTDIQVVGASVAYCSKVSRAEREGRG